MAQAKRAVGAMSRYTDACRSVGGVSDWLDMDPTPKVGAEVADLKSKIASIDPFMKGPTIPADVALQWKSYNDRANQFISIYDGEWIKNHPGDTTALNSLIADFEPFRTYYNEHAKALASARSIQIRRKMSRGRGTSKPGLPLAFSGRSFRSRIVARRCHVETFASTG